MRRRDLLIAATGLIVGPRPARSWQKRQLSIGLYFEFTIVHVIASGYAGFGICGASASLTNAGFWNSSAAQAAEAQTNGLVISDVLGAVGRPIGDPNRATAPVLSSTPGDVFAMAVRPSAKLTWLRNVTGGGTWFGDGLGTGVPETDTHGFDYSSNISGPIHAFGGVTQRNDVEYGSGTLNLGGSAFTGALPTDYVAWGVGDTLNPSDKSGAITLSGGNLTYSSVGSGDLFVAGQLARSIGTHA
jgi:hypothetical protein